ncbi:DrmB family protein [Virgibacillus kekensis]|uniref:DrmB family protein n=1 Tax=Virgibacillus kekensis TaxID=202261 RepID=A0ABV9DEX1_9BACI
MSKTLGELRPSQLIFHHGPGAIVDMLDQSVMIMGADTWKLWDVPTHYDDRVSRLFGVDYIKLLNGNPQNLEIKARPFPKWKVCPKCGMMTKSRETECYFCKRDHDESINLFPSRFVLACENGHISDFPWEDWVHDGKCCKNPILKMKSDGVVGSLADMTVRCVKCKSKPKSLAKIMKEERNCTGERTWLGDSQKGCNVRMQTVLRGASKLYSPVIKSILPIPLTNGKEDSLYQRVQAHKATLKTLRENNELLFKETAKALLDIDDNEIENVAKILDGVYEEPVTIETIRKQEWNTFKAGAKDDINDSGYKALKMDIHDKMSSYFQSILRVDSLPEIQVLQGFTRLSYLDLFEETEVKTSSIMKDENANWLPGVKNLGEGIFFEFNIDQLRQWEERIEVKNELGKVFHRFNERREQMDLNNVELLERHVLIHSFAHALIHEFARFSGYSTTSLRERIYSGKDMHGVLIYTSSSDSEGSLGGLIELAKPEKLYPIFIRALEKMEYCSSDPYCSSGNHALQSSINGAACHSCAFVSETSCEWGNQLLDRRVLLLLNQQENLAFFEV